MADPGGDLRDKSSTINSLQAGALRLICVLASGALILAGFALLWVMLFDVLKSMRAGVEYGELVNKVYYTSALIVIAWIIGGIFIYACSRRSKEITYY